jgi:hypothetical protein
VFVVLCHKFNGEVHKDQAYISFSKDHKNTGGGVVKKVSEKKDDYFLTCVCLTLCKIQGYLGVKREDLRPIECGGELLNFQRNLASIFAVDSQLHRNSKLGRYFNQLTNS